MAVNVPMSPIAIFAFNRVETLKRVLSNLLRCERFVEPHGRKVYAFVDAPRNEQDLPKTREVKKLLEDFRRCVCHDMEIVCREKNYGCENNIPKGIAQVLDLHGRAIIVEDDILVSRYFLSYMDAALELYADNPKIWCINAWRNRFVKIPQGYRHDVYLNNRNMCWGWGTWQDRFAAVDFSMGDWPEFIAQPNGAETVMAAGVELLNMLKSQYAGHLKTWDVQCSYHMVKNDLWAVEPRLALTKNIGTSAGTHSGREDALISTMKYWDFKPLLEKEVRPDERIVRQFRFAYFNPSLHVRIWRRLLREVLRFSSRHEVPSVL